MESAIWARGVCKTYGGRKGKVALDNLDITVKKGTIYGLLGASGCGKTTLLSAIVGRKDIEAGQIRVLGRKPHEAPVAAIGYMPQDMALVGELTVRGAINHFGWIFGMTDKEIENRFQFLNELLDLPPSDKMIKKLSGGQQRRVSLAAVLIHNPDLLILDEPTVGLDPVLRQNIWDYLVQLTDKEKKTIIITTHYIEEAKQAHTIGLMRNGKLLSQGPPDKLMQKYNCTTVEEVFLLLSRKQQEGIGSEQDCGPIEMQFEDISVFNSETTNSTSDEYFEDVKTTIWEKLKKSIIFTNRHHMRALMSKNFQRIYKNPGYLSFCFALPVIQMSLFLITIGGEPKNIQIGIINPEMAPFKDCQAYAQHMPLGSWKDPQSEACNYTGLSCKFLLGITSKLQSYIYFNDVANARKAIERGEIVGYMEFHKNFSMKTGKIRENREQVSEEDVDELQINIDMDRFSYPITKYLEKILIERYNNFSEELEHDCGYNPRGASIPIRKEPAVYSSYDANYSEFMRPGFMLTVSIFLAVSLSALTIVTERTEGTWDRTLVTGISTTEIVVFHFITMSLVNFCQNVALFIVTFGVFQVECRGNLWTVLLLISCQGLVGTCMGTFVSVISKTVTDCILMSLGMFYPFLVLSGIVWPLEGMHPVLKSLSYYGIPSTMSVEAMANVVNRGWTFLNIHVAKGVLSSVGWLILFNGINILILSREKK